MKRRILLAITLLMPVCASATHTETLKSNVAACQNVPPKAAAGALLVWASIGIGTYVHKNMPVWQFQAANFVDYYEANERFDWRKKVNRTLKKYPAIIPVAGYGACAAGTLVGTALVYQGLKGS